MPAEDVQTITRDLVTSFLRGCVEDVLNLDQWLVGPERPASFSTAGLFSGIPSGVFVRNSFLHGPVAGDRPLVVNNFGNFENGKVLDYDYERFNSLGLPVTASASVQFTLSIVRTGGAGNEVGAYLVGLDQPPLAQWDNGLGGKKAAAAIGDRNSVAFSIAQVEFEPLAPEDPVIRVPHLALPALDLVASLTDAGGVVGSVRVGALDPIGGILPLPTGFTWAPPSIAPRLGSIRVPLDAFLASSPDLDLSTLSILVLSRQSTAYGGETGAGDLAAVWIGSLEFT